MLRFIKKLQRKPEHIRSNISLFVAIGLTMLIFFAWVVTLDSRLSLNDDDLDAQLAGSAPLSLLVEQGRIIVEGIFEKIQSF